MTPANPMRAIGTMVDPNVLGGFLILVAGLTAPQLVSPQPLFRRRWVVLFLGVELLALYLTYSRGSLVGLAAGLLVIGLLRYRKLLLAGRRRARPCCCSCRRRRPMWRTSSRASNSRIGRR